MAEPAAAAETTVFLLARSALMRAVKNRELAKLFGVAVPLMYDIQRAYHISLEVTPTAPTGEKEGGGGETLAALIERLAEEQQEQIDNAYESSACILEDVDLTDLNNEDFAARIRAKKRGNRKMANSGRFEDSQSGIV